MLKLVVVDVVGADAGGCAQSLHSSSAMVIRDLKSLAVIGLLLGSNRQMNLMLAEQNDVATYPAVSHLITQKSPLTP